jgi:hypothetical protein
VKLYSITCNNPNNNLKCEGTRTVSYNGYVSAKKRNRNNICKSCSSQRFGNKNSFFGKQHSIETKIKLSLIHKGISKPSKSQEERQKMSIRMLGNKNPMYGCTGNKNAFFGKKHSIETKIKLRECRLGKPMSSDVKNKISKSNRIYNNETKYNVKCQRKHFHHWLSGSKNGFEKYIDLSLNEFKIWIQHQFKSGMSWDNHGRYTWHIDHIQPLHSLNSNKINFKLLWNYKNLRPLSATENLKRPKIKIGQYL